MPPLCVGTVELVRGGLLLTGIEVFVGIGQVLPVPVGSGQDPSCCWEVVVLK